MHTYTFAEDYEKAVQTLTGMAVTDLGRHGWGWRCECGHGHVEEHAQEGGVLTCEKCEKQYVCE